MHKFSYRGGRLFCEGVDLDRLAEETGTPAYVYSAGTLLENYRRLEAAFSSLDHRVCYAIKANSSLAVLDLLARAGSGFDIVSGGELFRVLAAGGSPARTTFAGVGKSVAEIETALRAGIYSLNVESEPELERIEAVAARLGLEAPVAIRVNPDVDAGTHAFISTGRSLNKFGIGLDRAGEVYRRAANCRHLKLRGIQTHIGSQILQTRPFVEAIEKLLPLVRALKREYQIEFFSIGGGMGIVYEQALASGLADWWTQTATTPRLDPETYAAALLPLLEPLGLKILLEPGRSLVGNAGALLATVEYVKQVPGKTFVIVDTAMNDLIRPALYDGWHEIVPLQEPASDTPLAVDVVGPVCESGDFIAKDRKLPPLEAGDRLAILSTGAYGSSMASNYNSRPLAPEILVHGDTHRVVRQRQTYHDLIANESEPTR